MKITKRKNPRKEINMKEKNSIDRERMKRFAVVILGLGLAFGFGPAARTATPTPEGGSSGFQFVADAYGTQATLGNVVVAGRTAVSSLGACGTVSPPVHDENTVASADATPLFTTGVINTTADGNILQGNTLQATATADVHPSTGPACVRSKITPMVRKVEPLPMPLAANSSTNSSMNTRKYCSGVGDL